MKYTEEKGDLFKLNDSWPKAHCISFDTKMGAGIAVLFDKNNPGMRAYIHRDLIFYKKDIGTVVRYHNPNTEEVTYNLITKSKYWEKPSYESFTKSIIALRDTMLALDESKIAMPILGAGLDKLSWAKNREIIKAVFADTDIEIRVVKLP